MNSQLIGGVVCNIEISIFYLPHEVFISNPSIPFEYGLCAAFILQVRQTGIRDAKRILLP